MKKFLNTKVKDMNAITLIALVITIVVLIILAAVAINLSLGNNGIFNRAKTAKEQHQNATEYEQAQISSGTNQINSYINGNRDTIVKGYDKYSNKEQIIGCWSNGKSIYRKNIAMYTYGLTSVGWHYFYSDEVALGSLNIEELISFKAINGTLVTQGTLTSYDKNNNKIGILYYGTDGHTNKLSGYTGIVEYTKTTDSANSFNEELVGTFTE